MTWRCDSIACRENGRYVDSGKADVDALVSGVLKATEGSTSPAGTVGLWNVEIAGEMHA